MRGQSPGGIERQGKVRGDRAVRRIAARIDQRQGSIKLLEKDGAIWNNEVCVARTRWS